MHSYSERRRLPIWVYSHDRSSTLPIQKRLTQSSDGGHRSPSSHLYHNYLILLKPVLEFPILEARLLRVSSLRNPLIVSKHQHIRSHYSLALLATRELFALELLLIQLNSVVRLESHDLSALLTLVVVYRAMALQHFFLFEACFLEMAIDVAREHEIIAFEFFLSHFS